MSDRPRIGLLGIMQALYDEMVPGITERQAAYARTLADRLGAVADVTFSRPARDREDIDAIVRGFSAEAVDGIVIVMLTYGPAMRTIQALAGTRAPLLLANVQPVRSIGAGWTMDDLTYNQGIHGAQDQANALVRSQRPFSVLTGDWRSDAFLERFDEWARAATTVSRLRRTKVALLGNPMNGMGDILPDLNALARTLGVTVQAEDIGGLVRRIDAVAEADVSALVDVHRERFRVAADLPGERHAYAARLELALRGLLSDGGYGGFSFHFDSIGGDGRVRQLPLLAASNLMADGYGFAAEGDVNTAALMCAALSLTGTAHFSELYAMDWELDSVLVSHMGEGNWRIARPDQPIALIDRPLGIGGLENPPTPVFMATPGPATTAALVQVAGAEMSLLVGSGEILDTPRLPHVPMHHFHFRPAAGMETFMDAWLRRGGPHHFITTLGDDRGRWRRLTEALGLAYEEI
ncbi:L-fucose/L-arabinose isomerase family protein [Conexibacter sp. DBS9H8]|uniref:L-fucose/L-arabinose isomerase family protein n=1 Tax=Conexibacter sp. DBS9H8 TaxID=2937801 RepID=UPI00200F4C26|nr:L-fucose/L-arabinose isomerase family protein [Conexibacter sp. DBS9H8]